MSGGGPMNEPLLKAICKSDGGLDDRKGARHVLQ